MERTLTDTRPVPLAEIGRRQRREVLKARRAAMAQEEGPPPGTSGVVTDEDLLQTQYRIRTGLPPPPMLGGVWRW